MAVEVGLELGPEPVALLPDDRRLAPGGPPLVLHGRRDRRADVLAHLLLPPADDPAHVLEAVRVAELRIQRAGSLEHRGWVVADPEPAPLQRPAGGVHHLHDITS